MHDTDTYLHEVMYLNALMLSGEMIRHTPWIMDIWTIRSPKGHGVQVKYFPMFPPARVIQSAYTRSKD